MEKKKGFQRFIISITYIILGVSSFLTIFDALKLLFKNEASASSIASTVITATLGVLMVLAGIFSLFRIQKKARVWMGILLFVVAVVGLVLAVISSAGLAAIGTALMQVAFSWMYIAQD